MCVPNFSSITGLEVAEKFVVVGWGGTVGHHAPLLSFLTAPLNQLLVLSALYGKLPAMFGDHFPILILIQGSLV